MQISLISEGITDRPIIEATLAAYFAQKIPNVNVFLNPIHPKDKEPSGWSKVLKFCESELFRKAFELNDFIIIQIDSDVHEEYEVQKQKNIAELIDAIKARIVKSIGESYYETVKEKIIFAICVNMIECWLLPFYASTNAHKKKINNCCGTLNQYLQKQGYTLDCTNDAGGSEFYQKAALIISKKKIFFPAYKENESLRYFVERELSKIIT
jgi:hypothetical protein